MILGIEPFVIRAAAAGMILSVPFSLLSFFVVTKHISFSAVSIGHATFGGVAIAMFIGGYILPVTMIFSVTASLIMANLIQIKITKDSSIGIVFSTIMALSIILISLSSGYQTDITSYLFGDILLLTNSDIIIVIVVSTVVAAVIIKNFWGLMLSTFSETIAEANGIPVKYLNYLFFALLGIVVAIGVKLLGILLISSFLILPASIGLNLSNRYKTVIILSFLSALISTLAGIYLSWQLNFPTGASIAAFASLLFFASLPFKER